ncbi:spermidine synthase [Ramlibacter sp. AN1015]|uniref:spermidine synthase n=1 Tax=Ramlibacter sp. AN1015 TaxID=3133428 RepID=UPI0030C07407
MELCVSECDGLRLLRFGTAWCQGAMRIDDPQRLELAYALHMSAWLLFHDAATLPLKHLVTIGLGAGSLTRFAHGVLGMRASAVEIEQDVIAVCRIHFLLPPDDERLRVVHAEGGDFIARQAAAHSIDVLQIDAYDAFVEAPALDTAAFYARCRRVLRADASVAVNLIGRELDVRGSVARIREGLRPGAVWQFPPTEAGNVVVLAQLGTLPCEEVLAARAADIRRRWDLPADEWLAVARRTGGRHT